MKLGFTVEYDGTTYSGFQSQKNVLTVQGCIENALKKVTKEDIRINYSGRTDAGVHAMSQVCDFETNIDRNKKNWLNGLNSNLPSSIAVKDINLTTFNDFIIITIIANAFLQNMVRIMVGTLIDIAKKENSMSIEEILDKKNRSFAGKTAPACGLFFLGPSYKDELKIKSCEKSIIERLKI